MFFVSLGKIVEKRKNHSWNGHASLECTLITVLFKIWEFSVEDLVNLYVECRAFWSFKKCSGWKIWSEKELWLLMKNTARKFINISTEY